MTTRKWILFFALMVIVQAGAQISVKSFQKLENDLSARVTEPKRDQNGELCAIIKVVTTHTGFEWEPDGLGITDVVTKVGEYWLYVPNGAKRITIKHPQLGILRNYFFPEPIEKATVYEMQLVTAKLVTSVVQEEMQTQWLIINSFPDGADIYLNDQPVGKTPFQRPLPLGKYTWRIQKELYQNEVGIIELTSSAKARVEVDLKGNFGNIYVRTDPESNARVSLDNINLNQTTPYLIEKIPVGDHTITVSADMFETKSQKINLKAGVTDTVLISMNSLFTDVTINSEPLSDIFINGQYKGNGTVNQKLAPGTYTFEAKLDKHNTAVERKQIIVGQPLNITLSPTPRSGSLTVMTTPYDAEIKIDGVVKGKTPETFNGLLIGDYILELLKDGYLPYKKVVSISEGGFTEINENLISATATGAAKVNSVGDQTSQNLTNNGQVSNQSKISLTIRTNPISEIFINGKFVGNDVWKGELDPGSYIIEAKGPNNSYIVEKRNLQSGFPINILLSPVATQTTSNIVQDTKTVEKQSTTVVQEAGKEFTIATVPSGADVYVNGVNYGKTPSVNYLDYGNYELKLKKDKYYDFNQTINLNPNSPSILEYSLVPKKDSSKAKKLNSYFTFAYEASSFINETFLMNTVDEYIIPNGGGVIGLNLNAYPFRFDFNGFIDEYEVPYMNLTDDNLVHHMGTEASVSLYLISIKKTFLVYTGIGYQASQLTTSIFNETYDGRTYKLNTSTPILKGGVQLSFPGLSIFAETNVGTGKLDKFFTEESEPSYLQFKIGLGIGL